MRPTIIVILVFVILVSLFFILLENGSFSQITDYATITSVQFDDDIIMVRGTLSESATAYQGYETIIEGDKLYISIKTGLSFINKKTDYNICLENTGRINEVFYKGLSKFYHIASRINI